MLYAINTTAKQNQILKGVPFGRGGSIPLNNIFTFRSPCRIVKFLLQVPRLHVRKVSIDNYVHPYPYRLVSR